MARAARSGSRWDTALLAACVLLSLFATVLPSPVREAIASSLRRTVVAPLLGLQERAEGARSAFVERGEVTARIDSLALRVLELRELEFENERLRNLLHLARALKWGFLPAEALQGTGISGEDLITITVGSAAGARSGAAVIAPDGLVGKVTSADPSRSMAIMWTHRDFRASAMAVDGSAFGIVRPHLPSGAKAPEADENAERYLMELRGVAFRDALSPGTLITTSGLGGVYPRGIPIGTVLGELQTPEQWSRTYLLRPAVRPPDITNVLVLLPERAEESLEGVWASTTTAEAAVRGIAAAGDSIARQRADSIARRQADSLAAIGRRTDSLEALLARPAVVDTNPPRP